MPKTTTTTLFKAKRKWQIAFRRYALTEAPCVEYAKYFGVSKEMLFEWIEMQLPEGVYWGDSGKKWEFDHIVPVTYFDFGSEDDMMLCWNFINIRVEGCQKNKDRGRKIDILETADFFKKLHYDTGFKLALKMVEKINTIQVTRIKASEKMIKFLFRKEHLVFDKMGNDEYEMVNGGMALDDILMQRQILNIL